MTDHPTSAAAPGALPAPSSAPFSADGTPTRVDVRPASGLLARSLAEGAGSFLILLAGLGATITASETALQPTLVFGFAVVAAMIAFGFASGGHFNPAITLGSMLAGRTAAKDAVPYIAAQLVGAIAASGLIWLVLSANPQLTEINGFYSAASNGFGEHSPIQFPLASAFLIEVVATALLVAVFLGAGSARARRDLAPFAVGLTYAGLLTFLLPVTNGGLNPARSTASAIFAEPWALEQLWLFWAAPVVGALIAGLAYRGVDSVKVTRPAVPGPIEVADDHVPTPPAAPPVAAAEPRSDGDAASFFETPGRRDPKATQGPDDVAEGADPHDGGRSSRDDGTPKQPRD